MTTNAEEVKRWNDAGAQRTEEDIAASRQKAEEMQIKADREAKDRKNAARRAKHQAYTDCGMKRVKGALGGVYYE